MATNNAFALISFRFRLIFLQPSRSWEWIVWLVSTWYSNIRTSYYSLRAHSAVLKVWTSPKIHSWIKECHQARFQSEILLANHIKFHVLGSPRKLLFKILLYGTKDNHVRYLTIVGGANHVLNHSGAATLTSFSVSSAHLRAHICTETVHFWKYRCRERVKAGAETELKALFFFTIPDNTYIVLCFIFVIFLQPYAPWAELICGVYEPWTQSGS